MKKQLTVLLVVLLVALATTAFTCNNAQPIEKTARDGIATANGYITAAKNKHPECSPQQHPENQSMAQCQVIKHGIDTVNVSVSALSTYCQFGPADPPEKQCVPVKTAQDGLVAALNNMNQTMTDVKNLLK